MATGTLQRTWNIKPVDEDLTAQQSPNSDSYYLVTSIPLSTPIVGFYPLNRNGWRLVLMKMDSLSNTNWVLGSATGETISGTYNMRFYCLV